jgi:colicin import membrane protein
MISERLNRAVYGNGLSLNRMIGLSFLIHIAALSLLIFSPSMPAPKWTFGPVYSVQLVNIQELSPKGSAPTALSREVAKPDPAPRPIILKRPVETVKAVPIRPVEVQKSRSSHLEKAMEAVRKKVQSSGQAAAPQASAPSAGAKSVASSPAPGEVEMDQRMAAYYAAVWAKIKGQWSLPKDILSRESMEAVIQARILRNGSVSDVSFEKRSGNRFFDDSAMKAVRKASPLPPLPEWIRDSSVEIGIRFHSSDFRS